MIEGRRLISDFRLSRVYLLKRLSNWLNRECVHLKAPLNPEINQKSIGFNHVKIQSWTCDIHKIYFTDTGLVSYLLGIETEKQAERDPLRGNLYLFHAEHPLDLLKKTLKLWLPWHGWLAFAVRRKRLSVPTCIISRIKLPSRVCFWWNLRSSAITDLVSTDISGSGDSDPACWFMII